MAHLCTHFQTSDGHGTCHFSLLFSMILCFSLLIYRERERRGLVILSKLLFMYIHVVYLLITKEIVFSFLDDMMQKEISLVFNYFFNLLNK
jgi:hypothetical protein